VKGLFFMNIDIPKDLVSSLSKISKKRHVDETTIVVDALRVYLEDVADAEEAAIAYEEWQKEGGESIPFEKILKDNGLA